MKILDPEYKFKNKLFDSRFRNHHSFLILQIIRQIAFITVVKNEAKLVLVHEMLPEPDNVRMENPLQQIALSELQAQVSRIIVV